MEKNRRDQHLRVCMNRSVREWGMEHDAKFSKRVREEAIRQADAVSETFPLILDTLKKNELPRTQEQAVKHALRKDLEDSLDENGVEVVRDSLDIPWPPFYQQPWDKTKYARSNKYEHFSRQEIFALKRFKFETISDKMHLYESWSDQDCLGGTVMEALVAHRVVHSGSCFHCKAQNRLRWNGGRDKDSSWTDLLCLHCQSTYEIKSKRDAVALEKVFKHKELRGGSFRLFHANRFNGGGKRYVVLVARRANDRGEFPVSIREIVAVEPALKAESFATYVHGYKLALGTRLFIKDQKELWCKVSSPAELRPKIWAKEVFDDHFGEGSWDNLATDNAGDVQAPSPLSPPAIPESSKEDSLEVVRRALEDISTENWDDSDDEAA